MARGIVAEAQVVDVPHLRMSEPVTARGEMSDLIAVFDSLAWKLTRQIDPGFNVAEETFVAAGAGMRLDAFEQYIRGITEPDQAERLRHLKQAVALSPAYRPGLDGAGARGLQRPAVRGGRGGVCQGGPAAIRMPWKRAFTGECRCFFQAIMRRPRRLLQAWRGFCRWPRW